MTCPSCNGSGVSVGTYACMLCGGAGGISLSARADDVLLALRAQAARHHIASSIHITLQAAIELIEAYKAESTAEKLANRMGATFKESGDGPQS